jgi:hypothetical protein
MRSIVIMVLVLFLKINNIWSQNNSIESLNINNDSVYCSLLPYHIKYFELDTTFTNQLYGDTIFVLDCFPITRLLNDQIDQRKIIVLSKEQLSSRLNNHGNFYAVEIRPIFIWNNNEFRVSIRDVYIKGDSHSYLIGIVRYSLFKFRFDCESDTIKLVENKHFYY